MSAKHTPGVWHFDPQRFAVLCPEKDGLLIAQVSAWAGDSLDAQAEAKCNARLIAAAPDLYDALEACADELVRLSCVVGDEDFDIIRGVEAQARAALSKAAPEEADDGTS